MTAHHAQDEAALLREHAGIIGVMAGRWRRALEGHGHDWEDVLQEASMAALRAIRAWRPDGGGNVCTLVVVYVTTAMRAMRTLAMTASRGGGVMPTCLSALGEAEYQDAHAALVCDGRAEKPEDEVARRLELEEMLWPILRDLESYCPLMARVVRLRWLEGLSYSQIARVTAQHKSRVAQLLESAMRRLRRMAGAWQAGVAKE